MKTDSLKEQLRRTMRRDLWLTVAPAALIIGLAFAVTFYFVKPAPPRTLVLATAQAEGGVRYGGDPADEGLGHQRRAPHR
jgi:hypothetical protein